MNNPWKLATIGLALTGVTAVSTGATTAYLMRPATTPAEAVAFAPAAPAPSVKAKPAVMRSQAVAPRAVAAPAPARPVAVQPVAAQSVATDCATGGQRAMKIAKPGLIGALGGAGLGAIGGALAGGGDGAGKGALIGGLAGTALGAGYGAYKTKQECGTIFGSDTPGFAGNAVQALQPTTGAGNGITIYNAR